MLPGDVFTLGIPIKETNVYASRGQAENDFRTALKRSQVPIVYGEYGVGKTSLARHQLLSFEKQNRLVNIESIAGKSLEDVFQRILEILGYSVERSVTKQEKKSIVTNITGAISSGFQGLTATITGQLSANKEQSISSTRELIVTSPTDSKLIELCEMSGVALLVDELHRADRQFIEDLSAFLKAYQNANCSNFKIALLGTGSDSSRLVDRDPGINRLVQETPLKSMTKDESRFVVEQGMSDLAIHMPNEIVEQVIKTAAGSPALIQYFSLEIAEAAFERTPRVVTEQDFQLALSNYLRRKSRVHAEQYKKSIETVGDKKYRKQILRAMAEIEDEFVTMDQIRNKVSNYLAQEVPSHALSGPLRQLKTPEFGPILKDVERHEGGERIHNYTTFVDPTMRFFIHLYTAAEQMGAIETDSEI